MSKPIQDSLLLVKQAQMEVNKNLASPEYNSNLLELNSLFQRLISRLVFMGGILEPDTAEKRTKLQPMTTFMGRPLKQDKVVSADLDPKESEKQIFLAKVEKLYHQISFIQPSIILNSYTIPEDVLVLRGVAKRSGVEGYESKGLTTEFIEEIQRAIEEKKKLEHTQKIIDTSSKKETEITATQEMIDKSKYLQKEKVKPGDKVLQLPDGKYKLPAEQTTP
jgi:hypothetical protein